MRHEVHVGAVTILLLPAAWLALGCESASQGRWLERLAEVTASVHTLARSERTHLLDTTQLRVLLGNPDYDMTAKDLLSALSESHREPVMARVRQRYQDVISGMSENERRSLPRLEDCLLYIYDESRHFPRPNRYPFDYFGFTAVVFFVPDNKAVGVCPVIHWEGLSRPGRQ